MTKILVRAAAPLDARPMADLLNEIISIGGTTAYVTEITTADMRAKMAISGSIWHVAETQTGDILGFQWLEPHADLPSAALDINSFVKPGATGLGIGSALFDKTRGAAKAAGAQTLHAIIRADNAGGLAYYQSRGFETYRHLPNQKLDNGARVDKIWKRYDLTI
ncbi:GNAT family N-acetyltransferase [Cognatishimia sp. SS12]|uniref:GNAT family N-acetyltransferase n=1 Tax=Cognatishimia sp. SS12 TaxID=2979465 RepID=UPI00233152B7|nr:GNAT family N-acetyltransferase [Cognatishimia sp. SS12]MDC0737765.1 GNAT family N-acetyltransferase [Cognatishimia sp. SS12]